MRAFVTGLIIVLAVWVIALSAAPVRPAPTPQLLEVAASEEEGITVYDLTVGMRQCVIVSRDDHESLAVSCVR